MDNYRHVDIELREALTIKYMKRVQELLTGRVVGKEDEVTLLKVVRLEANISRAMFEPAEEREEKEVKAVNVAWLQSELPFIDWEVFMEETIGEGVEVVVSNLAYLTATSRLLTQMLREAKGRKIVEQYLVSRKPLLTLYIILAFKVWRVWDSLVPKLPIEFRQVMLQFPRKSILPNEDNSEKQFEFREHFHTGT